VELECTCGARPPADARFCHKCGRPLYEEPVPEVEAAPPPPPPPPPVFEPPAPAISFQNGMAVRIGFLVAGIAMFASNFLALLGGIFQVIAFLFLPAGAGILSVWLYNRRSGNSLSVRDGARLGWITGVFCFVILTVMTTLVFAFAGTGGIANAYQTHAQKSGIPNADIERGIGILQDPASAVPFLLIVLFTSFMMFSTASSIGGAIGAKMLDKDTAARL
jgi:hypothetical protein